MAETRGLKALENWAKRVTSGYNGVNVTDMSSSFRDGLAFCAIIHHYYPDLIDFDSLSKENILHNNSLAFSTAEKQLGVPALLDAEDMVNYAVPDRLSIITYLSQLHNCFENQNRVNKVRPVAKRVLKEGQSGPPAKFPLSESRNSTPRSHEICQVCKHRVFILERLMVSGKLYHRTCFRCSKCDTLLKPGAYVESDNSGDYECAVCPRDEKKVCELPAENKSQTLQETNNCDKISNKSAPCESPIAAPKLPVMSSTLSTARNVFLKKSIEEKESLDFDHDVSPMSKSSSSDSLSTNSDHQALAGSSQNLDSGFKEESVSDDICSETSIKSNGEIVAKKILPSTVLQPLGLKSDTEPGSTYRPYQSVFTRELLHTTSLKSLTSRGLSPRSADSTSLSGPKDLSGMKLAKDVPLIRSVSYTTTTSLPTHNYSARRETKRSESSILPLQMEKSDSESNLNESINENHDVRLRSGSLKTSKSNIHDTLAGENDDNSKLKQSSDSNLCKDDVKNTYFSHKVKPYTEGGDRNVEFKFTEHPKDRIIRTTSVKELIQLREASIRDSKIAVNTYKFDSKQLNGTRDTPSSPESESQSPNQTDVFVDDVSRAKISEETNSYVIKDENSLAVSECSKDMPKVLSNDLIHERETQNNISIVCGSDTFDSSAISVEPAKMETQREETEVQASPDALIAKNKVEDISYPDDLNPFGDDDDGEVSSKQAASTLYPDSLNPFGDSDEDDASINKATEYDESKNPFASDDDDDDLGFVAKPALSSSSKIPAKVSVPIIQTSFLPKSPQCQKSFQYIGNSESPTGSIKGTLKKRPAPKPPHVKEVFLNTSLDSETSLSNPETSLSPSKPSPSPKMRKNKRAPPPPPSPSLLNKKVELVSNECSSFKHSKDVANAKLKSSDYLSSPKEVDQNSLSNSSQDSSGSQWKKKKRPAPPVPIPRRREIKKIPLHQITSEMNEIEEKQMDLEKHGRELEVLIRDRDKDEEPTVEEEEYIMQLFELVNQKNALFRRQAELMYIKRSQRLEEDQVELEYQIRCLMIKPASQKTDEDKMLEEKLVQQLLDVVDQRNEIVDSIEMDRRREAEEDVSVQEQMEIKNGDLPITAEIKEKSEHEKKEKKQKEKKKKKKKLKEKENPKLEPEMNGKKGTLSKKWFSKN